MELAAAMAALPDRYAHALNLQDAGLTATDLALRLGVEEELLPPLLELAAAKLAALLQVPE